MLVGKKVLLGISGSIAAYKSANLVRLLIKEGASVKVILTPSASEFITPLTLSTLSKNQVYSGLIDSEEDTWNNHVELALWADLFIIAPATAKTLSKMVQGNCDNLLLATYLSAKSDVYFAPAMDLDMYKHPSTKSNIKILKERGNVFIPAEFGELASGLEGEGRLAEPEHIVDFVKKNITKSLPLFNKKILISAGPTYELIDPVRFIGNYSSGKMGFSLALIAENLGAEVTLVSGPSYQKPPKKTRLIRVTSAEEMLNACLDNFNDSDITIMSAAIADFKPKFKSNQKIKKENKINVIELEPTNDVLEKLGTLKKDNQILVGFALESENEIENAKQKLNNKNLDFIVLNSLNDAGAGFEYDTNKVSIISNKNKIVSFDLKNKKEVASDILNFILLEKML